MVFIGTTAHSGEMERGAYTKVRQGTRPRHFIAEWRDYRGLTQEQVAGRTGMSVPQISKIENGRRAYRQSTLEQFAEALDCEPRDILGPPPPARNELAETMAKVARLDEARQKEVVGVLKVLLGEAA